MTPFSSGFFFTCMVSAVSASCSEGQVPRFCRNFEPVPQNYCSGVELEQMWHCKPGSNARCACRPPLFRAANRKCVEQDQCGQAARNRPQPETHVPRLEAPMEVPESLQANPKDEPNVRAFIQNTTELHLLEISEKAWTNSECICMDSMLISTTKSGAKRKIGCYVNVTARLLRNGQQEGPTRMKVVKSSIQEITAQFDVVRDDWLYVIVTSTGDDELQPTSMKNNDYLRGRYNVLAYDDGCLLLGFGSFAKAKFDCILLVSLDFDGEYKKGGETCLTTKVDMCRDEMLTVWTDDCKSFYKSNKRQDMLAAKEKLAAQAPPTDG